MVYDNVIGKIYINLKECLINKTTSNVEDKASKGCYHLIQDSPHDSSSDYVSLEILPSGELAIPITSISQFISQFTFRKSERSKVSIKEQVFNLGGSVKHERGNLWKNPVIPISGNANTPNPCKKSTLRKKILIAKNGRKFLVNKRSVI